MSELTRGRPGPFGCDNLHQYRLKRLRCQEITVSGRTIMSADFQSLQMFFMPIQHQQSNVAISDRTINGLFTNDILAKHRGTEAVERELKRST